jgi:hypothetical protein
MWMKEHLLENYRTKDKDSLMYKYNNKDAEYKM